MLRRLTFVAAGLVVALAITEGALRLTRSATEMNGYRQPEIPQEAARWVDHPFLPYAGRPGAEYLVHGHDGMEEVEAVVRNNALGFRTAEFPETKSEGAFHIVILGGSTTWGALAKTNADTWPGLLETRLRARYPEREIRVFSLAAQNATAAYSAVALALVGSTLEPDLVLAYHGHNDVSPAIGVGFRADQAHHFQNLALDRRWFGVQSSLPRFLLRSYAVTFLSAGLDGFLGANRLAWYVERRYPFDIRAPLDADLFAERFARNSRHLLSIDALARGLGGRALFSTFQFLEQKFPFTHVNFALRKFYEEQGLDYVDLDHLIEDEDRSLQFDQCHFTAKGRELVADHFFDAIVERGLIDASAR